jgi:hypothetical protein
MFSIRKVPRPQNVSSKFISVARHLDCTYQNMQRGDYRLKEKKTHLRCTNPDSKS